MFLHAQTAFVFVLATVTLTGVALLVGVDLRRSRGLRAWTAGTLLQSLGNLLMIASFSAWNHLLSSLAVGVLLASMSCWYASLSAFLLRTPSRLWVVWVPLCATCVQTLLIESFAARLAVVNIVFGGQLLSMGWLLVRGSAQQWTLARWRVLALMGISLSVPVAIGRVLFALFLPAYFPRLDSDDMLNVIAEMLVCGSVVVGTFAVLLAHRAEAEDELKRLARVDGLTGILNRRAFFERAEFVLQLAHQQRQSLVAVMLDIDLFKAINDTHGHPIGDRVIEHFAGLLSAHVRGTDLCGRYGGEEFVLLLPMSDIGEVTGLDGRIRSALQAGGVPGVPYRYSAGAAMLEPGESLADLLHRADAALYEAKRGGRDRLCTAGPDTDRDESICVPKSVRRPERQSDLGIDAAN